MCVLPAICTVVFQVTERNIFSVYISTMIRNDDQIQQYDKNVFFLKQVTLIILFKC